MRFLTGCVVLALAASALAQTAVNLSAIDALYPQLEPVYIDIHRNPELSGHEQRTAAKLAEALRQAGYDVTTGVGGSGVVGVLKNGPGPTLMLRTELDALPVPEQTGLPCASRVRVKDDAGADVPVMHALWPRSPHDRLAGHGYAAGARQVAMERHPAFHRPAGGGNRRWRRRHA